MNTAAPSLVPVGASHKAAGPVLTIGQASSAGRKAINQDFHGALVPDQSAILLKGAVIALADGISTSKVSHIAAETAIKSLLTDYYATPDGWTVRTAAARVIAATNSWLAAQNTHLGVQDADHGYVCTLSAMVVKAATAHLFHIGDSRIWRLAGSSLEPLTQDHALNGMLVRALGVGSGVEIDYHAVPLAEGDVFLLTTDGVHSHWSQRHVAQILAQTDPQSAAEAILEHAFEQGSADNLTVQIVRIDHLVPTGAASDHLPPVLPVPAVGDVVDGWTILRDLHGNHRSHIFLGRSDTGIKAVLKFPSMDLREDAAALRRLMTEEWIARRIRNPHVMSAPVLETPRTGLYCVTDFVEGQTLRQWMHDNPAPSLDRVRDILSQIIKGLRAFHRREMLHQDLRPENIMIDTEGHVRLIDFGSVYVAGVQESAPAQEDGILGTLQYTAPEYFSGEGVNWQSDLFSLGVIAYEMLTGSLPYGVAVGRVRSPRDRQRLRYRSAAGDHVPLWLDEAIARAVHRDPARRYPALSEFDAGLRSPSVAYRSRTARPLAERNPLVFWQTVSVLLACLSAGLIAALLAG